MNAHLGKEVVTVVLFLLAGVVCLVVLKYAVAGVQPGERGETYGLNARFIDVANLDVGATVTLAGVVVGRVSSITVNTKDSEAVVAMRLDAAARPITRDATARVVTNGLLGSRSVALEQGSDHARLKDGEWIGRTQGAFVLEDVVGSFIKRLGS